MSQNDLYDLSNIHFSKIKLIRKSNPDIEGCFVRFKVKCEGGFELYPAEKFCFVPKLRFPEFKIFSMQFNEELPFIPDYLIQLSLDEIKEIIIQPVLI